jgi:hypothetical protein
MMWRDSYYRAIFMIFWRDTPKSRHFYDHNPKSY